jgi:hypothetical protein
MQPFVRVAVVAAITAWGVACTATAAEPIKRVPGAIQGGIGYTQPACCCPDDHCRKPWPSIACLPRGECYVYCRKPFPAIPCPSICGTCDDYCRKPLPDLCPRPWAGRCVPSSPAR